MKIEKVYIEKKDKHTSQVIPMVKSDSGYFIGRQVPITNRVSYIEDRRVNAFNKEPFNANIFVGQIPIFKDLELKDHLPHNLNMLKHAGNIDRLGVVCLQRSDYGEKGWYSLDAVSALKSAEVFIENKCKFVPLEIPFATAKAQIKKLKSDCESILNPGQEIVLDLHIAQYYEDFKDALDLEIAERSKLLLITGRTISKPVNLKNYSEIWKTIGSMNEGDDMPLIIGKNVDRYQKARSNVASSFALNSFNIPVVAEKFYLTPKLTREQFNKKNLDKLPIYIQSEGGFVKSKFQEALYGNSQIKQIYDAFSLGEGLGPTEAVHCINYLLQQYDTALHNDSILNDSFKDIVKEKAKWDASYSTYIRPSQLGKLVVSSKV